MEKSCVQRTEVLIKILKSLQFNRRYLDTMMSQGYTSGLAWTSRNILELHAWAGYCAKSEENARRFLDDSARDAIGMLNIPDDMLRSEGVGRFRGVQDRLLRQAEIDNIDSSTGYFQVAKAAASVNLNNFSKYNMVLSKWAHPTALSVLSDERIARKMNPKFYEMGVHLADDAANLIFLFLFT